MDSFALLAEQGRGNARRPRDSHRFYREHEERINTITSSDRFAPPDLPSADRRSYGHRCVGPGHVGASGRFAAKSLLTNNCQHGEPMRGNTRSVKFGLRSQRNLLLPGEAPEDFRALLAESEAHFQPQTAQEREVVGRIVAIAWKLDRIDGIENQLLRQEVERLAGESHERRVLSLAEDAYAVLESFLRTIPFFRPSQPSMAKAVLVQGNQEAACRLEVLAVTEQVGGEVFEQFKVAARRMDEVFSSEATESAANPEYMQALDVLETALKAATTEVETLRAKRQHQFQEKLESLRFTVAPSLSQTRKLDRYRASLERSRERELAHLNTLI